LDELGTLGRALNNLGAAWYYMGDLDRASAYLEESLAIDRRIGRRDSVSVQLTNLGNVARRMGDTVRAHDLLREALQLKVELNDPRQIAVTLEAMAAVAVTTGDMPRAARLLGAARRVRTHLGAVSSEPEKAEVQQTADVGRRALGEVAWSAQFEAGRALALEDVVADALHADGR
jgi:Tfp pilus assembly protein PilF